MSRTIYRLFKCPNCGMRMTFPKSRKTSLGHIKTAYCPVCKKEVDYEQIE